MGNIHKRVLSPSKAFRWIHCPKSYSYDEYSEVLSPEFSHNLYRERSRKDGDLAHQVAKIVLTEALDKSLYIKNYQILPDEEISNVIYRNVKYSDEEMITYANKYKDIVLKELSDLSGDDEIVLNQIETIIDCSRYAENCIGTPDFFAIGKNRIVVVDYKYGKRVSISAKDNEQLMIYALGILSTYKEFTKNIDEVKLVIYQPRMEGYDCWKLAKIELEEWGNNVLFPASIKVTSEPNNARTGKWCKFCPGYICCKELQIQNKEVLKQYEQDLKDILDFNHSAKLMVKAAKEINNLHIEPIYIPDNHRIVLEDVLNLNVNKTANYEWIVADISSEKPDKPIYKYKYDNTEHEIISITDFRILMDFVLSDSETNDVRIYNDFDGSWAMIGKGNTFDLIKSIPQAADENQIVPITLNGRQYGLMSMSLIKNYIKLHELLLGFGCLNRYLEMFNHAIESSDLIIDLFGEIKQDESEDLDKYEKDLKKYFAPSYNTHVINRVQINMLSKRWERALKNLENTDKAE